ncbi:MAG: RES family NAD+ phosphorylase [Cyclobacteriaceae bacterium]|nr:RES family NAD+ phosphorylase [Cyclobacteriaceae bacterium HetDA_MAG_MS6]
MIVHRIAHQKYIRDLSGYGSYLYGGRWTLKGTYSVYTASTGSLAYLEYLVHQFERDTWPKNLMIASIEIKNKSLLFQPRQEDLPINWEALPYSWHVQQFGSTSLREDVLGLIVPSAIVDQESNVILNPSFAEFSTEVEITQISPLNLDKRFGFNSNP